MFSRMRAGEIGTKIRTERKKSGLTLKELAKRLGISLITLQRVETGKSSPSVGLLSEIAHQLHKPIFSFLEEEKDKSYMHIKRKNQKTISSPVLKVKVIGPRKMIGSNIMVTYGEIKKGKVVDAHTNAGTEWAYNLEGKCILKFKDKSFVLEAGDSISFNARMEHSVTALEKLKFIGIYVKDQEP